MLDLVSVIIPYYNSDKSIERCVNSVLKQTYTAIEILIIDDGSSSESLARLYKLINKQDCIKLLRGSINNGAGFTRNRGIFAARGRYIAFLDSDDFWVDNSKLERQISQMKLEGTGFCFSSYQINKGEVILQTHKPQQISFNSLKLSNYVGCLTAIYDIDFYGKQYMPVIRKRQDWALWLKLFRMDDRVSYIEEPLAAYTKNLTGSLSSSGVSTLLYYHWYIYRKVLEYSLIHSLCLLVINLQILFLKKWSLK